MDQTAPPSVWRGMMNWDTIPVTVREILPAEKGSKIHPPTALNVF